MMGFGVLVVIGVVFVVFDKIVVCFIGDGLILMNIQELVIVVQENVNIKIILMNNVLFGFVYQ